LKEKKPLGPQSLQKYIPEIVKVLKSLGGSGTSREVIDTVVKALKIPDKELNVTLKNGSSKVENSIAWGRMYLVKAGYIDNSKRGVWSLTEKGSKAKLNPDEVYKIFKNVHTSYVDGAEKSETKIIQQNNEEEIVERAEKNISYSEEILIRIKELSPSGFERLSQRLLRESGFIQVEVVGRSGDGGIDGHGILEINPLVTLKVIFQCKKYAGVVTPSQVRDFRGAMAGRAEKGIIITTGRFTQEARKEATREGANPIELVDGEKLVQMMEKLEIGLKPVVTYEVDYNFFNEFVDE
jgi:restriction system protein